MPSARTDGVAASNATAADAPAPRDLDMVLAAARDADPSERIDYRDPIAAHGENAIEAMTD